MQVLDRQPPLSQVLHVVKAQCSASSFVTKVKLVERCFDGDATVRFEMYDAAPAAPPTQLPYFVDGADKVQTDENGVVRGLGEQGAAKLVSGDGVDTAAVDAVLASSADVSKAVKAATKSKTEQVRRRGAMARAAWAIRCAQQGPPPYDACCQAPARPCACTRRDACIMLASAHD